MLANVIEDLAKQVTALRSRLEPVTESEPPSDEGINKEGPFVRPQIVSAIQSAANKVEAQAHRIAEVMTRLAI